MSNRYDYPIPIRMELKNFMSHGHTTIDFGNENENIFITGASGKGKSAIQKAIQIALGKKIDNPNEVFSYKEIEDGSGGKRRIYNKDTEIILELKNSGITPIAHYPKDSIIKIRCELNQSGLKGNNVDKSKVSRKYYEIAEDKVETRKTLNEITIFGDCNDLLVFIPQRKTRQAVDVPPSQRFENMEKFIGAKEYRKKVRAAILEFKNADKDVEATNKQLENMKTELRILRKDLEKYNQKVEIEKKVKNAEYELELSQIYENFDLYKEKNTSFIDLDEMIVKLEDDKSKNQNEITEIKKKIHKLNYSTRELESIKEHHLKEKKNLDKEIIEYEYKLERIENGLSSLNIVVDSIQELDYDKEISEISGKIEEVEFEIKIIKNEINEDQDDLKNLQIKKIKIPNDGDKLCKLLQKNNVSHQYLYESLELKENYKDWRSIIESALGYRRYAVIVEENNRKRAQKINRNNNFDALLFYSEKKLADKRRPHKDIKNWKELFKIIPINISYESILNVMDLSFGNNYFADNFAEKEENISQYPWINVFCKDNYSYTNYSQRMIKKQKSYIIGKKAIKLQIQRLEERILGKMDNQKKKQEDDNNFKKSKQILTLKNDFLKLKKIEPVILENKKKTDYLYDEIQQINSKLASPQQILTLLKGNLTELESRDIKFKSQIKEKEIEYLEIQKELTELTNMIVDQFIKIYSTENSQINSNEIKSQVIDRKINYISLDIDNFSNFLLEFKRPVDSSEVIKKIIAIHQETIQNSYNNVDSSIIDEYNKSNDMIDELVKRLIKFNENLDKCRIEYENTENLLRQKLINWQGETGKIFQEVMRDLELDGQLEFHPINDEGDYELNLKVANSVEGALVNYEESGFSGGEQQRTAVALMITLLSKSNYTYTIWDEFDSEVDESKRELIANCFQKYLPNRKIIGISPRELSKGYLKVFTLLYEVWKNQDNQSVISILDMEDYFGKND